MLLRGSSFEDMILIIPAILIGITFHELAHGYVAYLKGDPTAKNLGRLTLNPIKHLDVFGTLTLLLVGFGWAKPVPVNPMYFKDPKKDMAIVGLAGPLINLILAFFGMIILEILSSNIWWSRAFVQNNAYINTMIYYIIMINIALAVFNLLPIPPLDGSKIFSSILPSRYYFGIMKYENYAHVILLILLFTGVLSPVLRFAQLKLLNLLKYIVDFLPL